MERVAFLVEQTGERLGCLLNPDSLVFRRTAGLRSRPGTGGLATASGLTDDPVLLTGGGRTELELELLFDISLVGSTIETEDVQDLTRPLWNLAENRSVVTDGYGLPPAVRFVWGKAWNLLGYVSAVAERFERFSATGTPQRSWIRMRLRRTAGLVGAGMAPSAASSSGGAATTQLAGQALPSDEQMTAHAVVSGERIDEIASRYYGDPAWWRALAAFNGIADPSTIPPPDTLQVPPLVTLMGQA
jgi:nucleoid-associated protein YgaU